ncbi:ATP-binding cassette domain-containing protein [Nonomuraea pusilla]|uniref:ABC-2 type transport system ATP-binding protein n=1 Tax=Nonomuraea pusilla TaxID=46177 RepID=A0A1H7FSW7_9ACTN|nr:ABC transporter ATP-binding protein [Nonomuraea pusilla]SEK28874.1 ABC-2 type transport system ATP-binding protein [Nonomuraea pusilla]
MTPLLDVTDLSKGQVLEEVSFTVERGEIVCVVGPPGSGKTALMECLAGAAEPDAGGVEMLGRTVGPGDPLPPGVAVSLGDESLPDRMKVAEVLSLFSRLYGTRGLPPRLLDLLDLEPLLPRRFKALTDGQRRRVMIALALAGNPELVLLDGPTTGLKPGSRQRIEQALGELRDGYGGVCVTLDDLAQAERLADRVVLLRRGRVLAEGSPSRLIRLLGSVFVLRVPSHMKVGRPREVRVLPYASSTYLYGSRPALEAAIQELAPLSGDRIWSIRPPTLRDAYLTLAAVPEPAALERGR